jgi:hypothetical protein
MILIQSLQIERLNAAQLALSRAGHVLLVSYSWLATLNA